MAEGSKRADSRFATVCQRRRAHNPDDNCCDLPSATNTHQRTAPSRCTEMSNVNITVLSDAEAVPVRALADQLRMHPVDVVKDLRGRGYTLGSIRGAVGRWTMALTRGDAERYLAERRKGEAGAP